MTRDEYNTLFHKLELNLVAFNQLMYCDEQVLKLVNYAIEQECEACANICDEHASIEGIAQRCAAAIRARSKQ
jgi:hypothetical protein